MTQDPLETVYAERESIDADRYIDLLSEAVASWQSQAGDHLAATDRRGYDRGYHAGQSQAYRNIAFMLKAYRHIHAAQLHPAVPTVPEATLA